MADSTYLKHAVEPFIVQWVSQRIGVALQPRRCPAGPRADGTVVHFEFDGVSEDGRTGLLVSTSLTVKHGGTRKLRVDASNLLRAPFQRRIMAFISGDVRLNFLNKCDGLLPLREIEMLVCDALPEEIQKKIAEFQAKAKVKVGDRGNQWKPGGPRG